MALIPEMMTNSFIMDSVVDKSLDEMDSGFVYFFSNQRNVKIGYTKNKPIKRLCQLNTGSDEQLIMLGYMKGSLKLENELHKLFGRDRIRLNGEWFYPSDNLIDFINQNNEMKNCYVMIVDDKVQVFKSMKIT